MNKLIFCVPVKVVTIRANILISVNKIRKHLLCVPDKMVTIKAVKEVIPLESNVQILSFGYFSSAFQKFDTFAFKPS